MIQESGHLILERGAVRKNEYFRSPAVVYMNERSSTEIVLFADKHARGAVRFYSTNTRHSCNVDTIELCQLQDSISDSIRTVALQSCSNRSSPLLQRNIGHVSHARYTSHSSFLRVIHYFTTL